MEKIENGFKLAISDYLDNGINFKNEENLEGAAFCGGVALALRHMRAIHRQEESTELFDVIGMCDPDFHKEFFEGINHGFMIAQDIVKRGE